MIEPPQPPLSTLLRKLRPVAVVAATGSTVRAAGLLHMSQSAVARAVQDVEARVACTLFERGARGMRATPAGQRLAQRVDRALAMLAAADARPLAFPEPAAWVGSRLAGAVAYRHLAVFVSLATTGREKQSAAELALSASAVAQTLSQLEHMAGKALFERARSGLRLTERGDALHKAARLALSELARAGDEAFEREGQMSGSIVIGSLPFSTGLFLPRAVEGLLARHPDLRITVIDGTYDTLLHQLRYAGVDLIVGALRDAAPGPDIRQETLFLDRLAVVARNGHPWSARRNLRLEHLREAQWVLPMPGTPAQAAFEQVFEAEGLVPPSGRLRVNSALVMMALVAESNRLALMSSRQVGREVRAGLLSALPVAVQHGPRRIGIASRSDDLPSTAIQRLLEALRSVAGAVEGEP